MTAPQLAPTLVPIGADSMRAELVALGGPKLARACDNALRRGGRRIVSRAAKEFQSRAIGRSLFLGTKGRRAARSLIKTRRLSVASGGLVRGIEVLAKGLAAIQEHGGPIAPHVIKPRLAPGLAFMGPAGATVADIKEVHHPGGTLPAFPVLGNAVSAEEASIRDDIDELIAEHIRDVIG